MTQAELAAAMHVDTSTLSQMENGHREPNATTRWAVIEAIANAKLRLGFEVPPPPLSPEEIYPSTMIPLPKDGRIPIIGTVPGGPAALRLRWSDATAQEGFDTVDRGDLPMSETYFAVRVDGDSMAPALRDGDVCICSPLPSYEDIDPKALIGKIVVVQFTEDSDYNGECTVARWKVMGKKIVLTKDNPMHAPMEYPDGGVHHAALVIERRTRTDL